MRFLADMGISPRTVAFLRDEGHDALHLAEVDMHRASDESVLGKARQEDRVLLTHDLDFAMLMATSRARLPSVIIFRLVDMQPENVNRYLARILADHRDALGQGAILSVAERSVRIRRLPIGE